MVVRTGGTEVLEAEGGWRSKDVGTERARMSITMVTVASKHSTAQTAPIAQQALSAPTTPTTLLSITKGPNQTTPVHPLQRSSKVHAVQPSLAGILREVEVAS